MAVPSTKRQWGCFICQWSCSWYFDVVGEVKSQFTIQLISQGSLIWSSICICCQPICICIISYRYFFNNTIFFSCHDAEHFQICVTLSVRLFILTWSFFQAFCLIVLKFFSRRFCLWPVSLSVCLIVLIWQFFRQGFVFGTNPECA